MEQDWQEEWSDFRRRATDMVRRGYPPEREMGFVDGRFLQVLKLSSFHSVIGWEIFQRKPLQHEAPLRYIAMRTEWQQAVDVQKFAGPVEQLAYRRLKYLHRLSPTMTFSEQEIDTGRGEEIRARLAEVVIPMFTLERSWGLDGTRYEVTVGDVRAGVTVQWWGQAPAAWHPLSDTVMPLFRALEGQYHE